MSEPQKVKKEKKIKLSPVQKLEAELADYADELKELQDELPKLQQHNLPACTEVVEGAVADVLKDIEKTEKKLAALKAATN